jgi:serine/threonine-protein kinase RsbT
VLVARTMGRQLAAALGFTDSGQTKIATAISELARNIVMHAKSGVVEMGPTVTGKTGIEIVARDRGPGIPDVNHVLSGNYHSKTGLGLGLV